MKLIASNTSQMGSCESASSTQTAYLALSTFKKQLGKQSLAKSEQLLEKAAALIAVSSLLTLVKHSAL